MVSYYLIVGPQKIKESRNEEHLQKNRYCGSVDYLRLLEWLWKG